MFHDPRSGTDRRASRDDAAARLEEDKRNQTDRRAERDGAKSDRWWLLRRYVNFERFFGSRKER
jgi:hypothetical protein